MYWLLLIPYLIGVLTLMAYEAEKFGTVTPMAAIIHGWIVAPVGVFYVIVCIAEFIFDALNIPKKSDYTPYTKINGKNVDFGKDKEN